MKFICFASAALAAMSKRDAMVEEHDFELVQVEAGQCVDSDVYFGWTDSYGDGCDWYYGNEEWCGWYDDADFWAYYDCCACGGGAFNYGL